MQLLWSSKVKLALGTLASDWFRVKGSPSWRVNGADSDGPTEFKNRASRAIRILSYKTLDFEEYLFSYRNNRMIFEKREQMYPWAL